MTVARSNADDEDGTDRQRRGETRRARQIHPMECLRRGQTRRGAGIETKVPNVIAIVSFDRKPLFLQALLESYAEQHLWRLHLHYGRHLLCGRSCPGQFSCLRDIQHSCSSCWSAVAGDPACGCIVAQALGQSEGETFAEWIVRSQHCQRISHASQEDVGTQAVVPHRQTQRKFLPERRHVFCFCHLVNEGLILQDTVNNMRIEGQTVRDTLKIAFHVLRPIYSFYQLFIAFKYSNIVINHAFTASRFGMMHLIGTCLYFWFSSIVQEYHHSTHGDYKHGNRTILDFTSVTLYLQPFTIEYQIILAGVWYIVWQNIGTDPPGQTRRQSEGGEAKYHSNLVVSADCHAANKGLFAGIFLLLCAIVSLVIEQVAFSSPAYHSVETIIFLAQNTALVVIALLAVVWGYKQISTLDLNTHPITLLDDVLLYVPLPFYFVYYIVTIIADMWYESYTLLTSHVVTVIQVVLQTLFLSDGLRRCSNSRRQKFTKPGRETVTFLIVCNIAIWVTNTFQTEKPHLNNYMRMCFGESAWVMVKHSTLPLMLFYRFHSSVCLADIWKSAYESDIAL
ncbi:proton channel OtopLc-like isoform X2 [Ornithodoros turicata]|uniref:proton channel OtopLc-like isoform X2 n=1 Tax=Ornithodoros turicata TaxID=34597 RepID=UPI0031391A50